MRISQAPLTRDNSPANAADQKVDRKVTPEMRKAAEGLEAVFTSQLMKVMRTTVEPSEFSLHNSATDVYQGMLDEEYSDMAAKQNSLGLSEQIIDYWLRDKATPQYNQGKGATAHSGSSGKVSTGGTHEDQSKQ
jgi:Rod binding domain-containing protein